MAKQDTLKAEFEKSIQKGVVTGSLKFSNLYCSQFQLFTVVKEWIEKDLGVVYASIRVEGEDFFSMDFRYKEQGKEKSILYDFLKPYFEEKLGGDYIQAWSIGRESIIVK